MKAKHVCPQAGQIQSEFRKAFRQHPGDPIAGSRASGANDLAHLEKFADQAPALPAKRQLDRRLLAVTGAERGETEASRYAGRRTRTTKLEGVRALVVDDEPGARELLSATLGQYEVFVTGVDSTDAALAAIDWQSGRETSEPFDILISNIEMPGCNGYELMKRLRTHTDERVKRIRAIAVTAYGRTEDRVLALQAGFQMHVPKPIDEEELTTVIAALIDRL